MNSHKKAKILIVDKSAGGSFLLVSILSSWGHEVTSVNSFLKAIEYCKNSFTPDIVIVEMQDPSMLFYEFPQKLQLRTEKKISVLVHSNVSNKEVIFKSIQAGYHDYLLRPVDPEILHDKILNIISPEIKLNQKTFNFKMKEEAKFSCSVTIESVNEFGIQASIPFFLVPGTLVDLDSPIMAEHGLTKLSVKVVDIITKEKAEEIQYPYLAKLSFVGLKNSELIKLRKLAIFKGEAA